MSKNPPILYTSYESWTNYCDDDKVLLYMKGSIKEIFGLEPNDEHVRKLSYAVIEMMQLCEKRKECYEILQESIKAKYKNTMNQNKLTELLEDKMIYKYCTRYIELKNKESADKLNIAITYNFTNQCKKLNCTIEELFDRVNLYDKSVDVIDDAIQKRYSLKFPEDDLHEMLDDNHIFKYAVLYIKEPTAENTAKLHAYLDKNLMGMIKPSRNDPQEMHDKYKNKLQSLKLRNEDFLIN